MFATNQFKTRFCSVCFWPPEQEGWVKQRPILLDDRTGRRRGLEHPGCMAGDSTTRPWSHWRVITSLGRDLVNPFSQILMRSSGLEQWFTNLAAYAEAPGEL